MHKILVVARREFNAAVRTKTFLISLLIMPVLMGGSIVVQVLLEGVQDTRKRTYAVIDRTSGQKFLHAIEKDVKDHNEKKQPPFVIEAKQPEDSSPEAVNRLREELSERVRKGTLNGFLEIGSEVGKVPPSETDGVPEAYALRYQSNRLTQEEFRNLADKAVNKKVKELRYQEFNLNEEKQHKLEWSVKLESKGLTQRTADGGFGEEGKETLTAGLLLPAGMMMLMFMVVMMVANPLLQGVIEEKMQRIAEVLLGSVRPFELMMGKLLGMTAVSLTVSGVYLAGAYWAAFHFRFAGSLPVTLLAWFLVYQVLAGLLYGSLFIAIGAACTDMKEAQNLLMPVMLLVCLPLFVLGSLIREPNSAVVTGLSFFPFATPMLMIARQAAPPGIPWWQPLLGIASVLATVMLCVWAAGRIFRVGLLMQGKGARVGEMLRWVFRG